MPPTTDKDDNVDKLVEKMRQLKVEEDEKEAAKLIAKHKLERQGLEEKHANAMRVLEDEQKATIDPSAEKLQQFQDARASLVASFKHEKQRLRNRQQQERKQEKKIKEVLKYTEGMTELKILQDMCDKLRDFIDLGKDGAVPGTRTQCKSHLKKIYINIFDYIQGIATGKFLVLKSVSELNKRCNKIGRFPLERAKSKGLKVFLKNLYRGH